MAHVRQKFALRSIRRLRRFLGLRERQQNLLTLRDVAKRPQTSQLVVKRQWPGISLENPAILEMQQIALFLIRLVDLFYPTQKTFRIGQLIEDIGQQPLVLSGADQLIGYPLKRLEAVIGVEDGSIGVHHQNAIGGGIQRGAQHGFAADQHLLGVVSSPHLLRQLPVPVENHG